MNDELQELVRSYLTRLAGGEVSPGDATDWAFDFVLRDSDEFVEPAIWKAIHQLSGADSLVGPGRYLYGPEDFADWLAEFQVAYGD